ncbi:hypothetical protein ACEUZ9_001572 [Paracoccus litorisediminis]|uniref:Uncharacterized protein n=1 Tax=Paracoccus litorisediminis TaxID=2006130 RepID=A0A844HHK0_9RHOB|nr:hypothetical protein [Paracoccus litorisediminis]MTH57665.1 hypothetical protein [Paracoccus litorisediminis]
MTDHDHQDRHPFASGRAAADFHVSADDMSPEEAMDVRLLTARQRRLLNRLVTILVGAGMCAALMVIGAAGSMLAVLFS